MRLAYLVLGTWYFLLMAEVLLLAPEIHCDQCKTSIEGAVSALEGVESVEVAIRS